MTTEITDEITAETRDVTDTVLETQSALGDELGRIAAQTETRERAARAAREARDAQEAALNTSTPANVAITTHIAAKHRILDVREAAFRKLTERCEELRGHLAGYVLNPDVKGLKDAISAEGQLQASETLLARLPKPEDRTKALYALLNGSPGHVSDPFAMGKLGEEEREKLFGRIAQEARDAAADGAPLLHALAVERAAHLEQVRCELGKLRVKAATMPDDDLAIARQLGEALNRLKGAETELQNIRNQIDRWSRGEGEHRFGFEAFRSMLNELAVTLPTLPTNNH